MASKDPTIRLLCLLCSHVYDKPRMLPCQHSFCEECLRQYIGSTEISVKGQQSTFNCPVCGKPTHSPDPRVDPSKWASLFPLNGLFESLLTLKSASVINKNFKCDQCKMVKESNKASFCCVNCSQNLCKSCKDFHLRNRFTSKHKINVISEQNGHPPHLNTDTICNLHPGKVVDRFCYQHQTLCCRSCITNLHSNCHDIKSIKDITSDGTSPSGETTARELDELGKAIKELCSLKQGNIKKLDCENAKLLTVMTSIVENTKNKLDDLLENFKENLHLLWEDNRDKLTKDAERANMFLMDLENCLSLISALQSKSMPSQLFIAQEMVKTQVKEHFNRISTDLENDVAISEVDMDMQIDLLDCAAVSVFADHGGVSMKMSASPETKEITRNLKDMIGSMECSYSSELQENTANLCERSVSLVVEMLGGQQAAKLTGGTYLPHGKVLLADQKHRRLLLFDELYKIEKAIPIDKPPSDLAYSSRYKVIFVAVGYYFDKEVQKYSFENNTLEYKSKLKVPKGTWGISVIEDIILAGGPNSIEMISVDGTSLNSFPTNGVCTFVATSRHTDSFWFKDGDDVVCMKLDGTAGFRYHDDRLKGLSGITCDQFGNAYVCSRDSCHVHQILKDGSYGRVLLNMEHNIERPCGIVFHPTKYEFIITSDGESTAFEVYKFA